MIGFYDLLAGNKVGTEVLSLAIVYIAHLGNYFNHIFAVSTDFCVTF